MSSDEKIHTLLNNISEELKIESNKIKNLDSYDGDIFIKKKYNVISQSGVYGIGESLIKNCPAIYIFYSKDGIENIAPSFNDVAYGSKAKQKKDTSKNFVYLGKSYTVEERINEHLSGDEVSPYSLKYNHENRKNVLKNTVLYIFELKENFKEYKEIILPRIEANLHSDCKPMIGSGRV